MVMHHLNSQEYALFWDYFVLEIIVTDCTHSKSAKFWLMYVPAPLECSILERTLLDTIVTILSDKDFPIVINSYIPWGIKL